MNNTTFILIALFIILLCGLVVPFYKEGFVEGNTTKKTTCGDYSKTSCAKHSSCRVVNNKCVDKN